ncbi:dTDP-4-dehydrorhamnose 3,5-epimerase [Carboxylicivirga linearis]|uniref:dTDP-4-dehydrorhamnose 3,5-epimerase n=1 Tax=Carboxylicivirga linearis TaxID=1628157 RepID=A0ABS5JW65_9BACT|nr:dTDP-4-dehydrorhamnose 3,5-epimerase [Carboxylicivirga linearis]MBS2098591.1 dTDP-4-dehydrorhamnose 3,5-epimerase [Carboxylicivirga linearis]
MKIEKTHIPGLVIIQPQVFADDRGFFMESYNENRYFENEVLPHFVQDNISKSCYGTVRGLHYQLAPFAQSKLVQVIEGKVLDVAVDLRIKSPTFGQSFSIELSAKNKTQFFIPQGFAHGFSVLSETAIFMYKCDNYYNREAERGLAYNDTQLNIDWKIPQDKIIISQKDGILPTLREAEYNFV